MWWQGPKPSMFSAVCIDLVPVRPSPDPTTFRAMSISPDCDRTLTLALGQRSIGPCQHVEALTQVGDQIVGVFQADVEPHDRAIERGPRLAHVELRIGCERQAFEAAPREAE